MNRSKLKNYAPQARRDFIRAITDRAAFYGLSADRSETVLERGDVAVIGGREHPRAVAKQRRQLEDRIKRHGFEQTMEAFAYTWFNRLVAIRFMELHGYLEHGYRVLSHPEDKPTPEILEHAEHVELAGLKKETVIDLKLAANKEAELYRLLITAQCNALNAAMPFLFERIDDETELLLPDNLLHSDSLIRKLVSEIDEEDWQEVEIIGWLYQFYISEKKEQVIGNVVASEDIPAATQLFTPNWIVKYLVQNTLGRQWLATYPQSALRQQMSYYIEPAEQTPEVQEQLKALTPTSLNPEELTALDPACGSGHILVEAYDLFKSIYQERGYRAQDIPSLILRKNLFGLEIDGRATQLSAFALMMKARADDRRIFDSEVRPNILAFEDSQGMIAADIAHSLNSPISRQEVPSEYLIEEIEDDKAGLFSKKLLAEKGRVSQGDIESLLKLFENAKTFGSLIQVPPRLAARLPEIDQRLDDVLKHGDLAHASAHVIKGLLRQAHFLAAQYDAVVANPPYMGRKHMNTALRAFTDGDYPDSSDDLFAVFLERGLGLTKQSHFTSMVTMHSWMYLSSFETMRKRLIASTTIVTCAHLGAGAFSSIGGAVVQTAACCFLKHTLPGFRASFFRLLDGREGEKEESLLAQRNRYDCGQEQFKRIPGSPICYWEPESVVRSFEKGDPQGHAFTARKGLVTLDDARFVRRWSEVSIDKIEFAATSKEQVGSKKWVPLNKGGGFRRWFGFNEYVINWLDDGRELKDFISERYGGQSYTKEIRSEAWYFKENITWGKVSNGLSSFRYTPPGFIFGDAGPAIFPKSDIYFICGLLNSAIVQRMLAILCPTMNFAPGEMRKIPVLGSPALKRRVDAVVRTLIQLSRDDWDTRETSWGFQKSPLLADEFESTSLVESYHRWSDDRSFGIQTVKSLEQENNRLLLEAYELQDDISETVPENQIALYRPDSNDDIKRLISYAIGCAIGRYSLDKPGVIYANGGNEGFDASQYATFRADDDGIMPLLASDWGIRDDAADRIAEFIGAAWPKEHLEENLKFIATSLGTIGGEQPRTTIRRYLVTAFYKHHLSMYKKRPIYWQFSSGKQRAFQCLVYLHRYHDGTLARMRTEYVIPLQGQIASRLEQLEGDKAKATSTSHRRKLQKEQDDLKKQQAELVAFEEKLKHAADHKVSLDLDDGVKVNYRKFGDLLAEAKSVAGEQDDE